MSFNIRKVCKSGFGKPIFVRNYIQLKGNSNSTVNEWRISSGWKQLISPFQIVYILVVIVFIDSVLAVQTYIYPYVFIFNLTTKFLTENKENI